jgi:site-specific recombinase XerD
MNTLKLSQSIQGYMLYANVRRLSPHTLIDYGNTYRKLQEHLGHDLPINQITSSQISSFLAAQPVSNKTILNYHTGLSALWSWAMKENLVHENIIHSVPRPKPEKREIQPFTNDDIRSMLSNIEISKIYQRPGKRPSAHCLPNSKRDRAIILLLLDTGIRSSELCDLQMRNLDIKNSRITVFGKGNKQRTIPFSPRTGQAIWRYINSRKDPKTEDFIFQTNENHQMDNDRLFKLIHGIGERSGVTNAHPHRFRHTFAIMYLRNHGDPWSLQRMLGHESMEMVSHYLAIAQADMDASHHLASPVENLRL